jgi:hypothetical protein
MTVACESLLAVAVKASTGVTGFWGQRDLSSPSLAKHSRKAATNSFLHPEA